MDISVVVPVFNSQDSLAELSERIEPVLAGTGRHYELILVNDGSQDSSWQRIEDLAARFPWIRGINLMRNYGQHNALLCGIRSARYAVTVTMDDDLQHPPEEIPILVNRLEEGFDVVYGYPVQTQHGLWRDLASQVTKIALQNAMGSSTARRAGAFRAFRTHLRDVFVNYAGSFVSIDVLLTWGARSYDAVAVRHEPRRVGRSNYTFRGLTRQALNIFTGYSQLPLQLASILGILSVVFGLVTIFCLVLAWFLDNSVSGIWLLVSVISLFSGAQLLSIGILGEYIAGIHFRAMERPQYVVQSETAKKES